MKSTLRSGVVKSRIQKLCIALAVLALLIPNSKLSTTCAQGTTAFTYQGQLRDNGTNASGTYTMIFYLYDSASGGNLIGGPITTSPTLANGLFTVNLDFGTGAFNGSARYLDITVQSGSDSEELSPRVQVLPSPYALYAAVAATVTNGAIMNAQLAANAVMDENVVSVSGSKVTGSVNSAIDADLFDGLDASNFASTDDLTNFATLDGDQTFTGQNTFSDDTTFSQDIIMGDWDIGLGESMGYSDLLSFSQGGNYRIIMFPSGFSNGSDNGELGMEILGGLGINGELFINGYNINMYGGDIDNVNNIETGSITITGGDGGDEIMAISPASNPATALSSQDILDGLVQLKISHWRSKNPKDTAYHIGPRAKDFNASFGFGNSTNLINLADESGVALAAIQDLNQKLEDEAKAKDVKIRELEKQLAELKEEVKTLATSQIRGAK